VRGFLDRLGSTVIRGVLVVVPVLIVYWLAVEMLNFVASTVRPVAEVLPWEKSLSEAGELFTALIILIALSFLVGLATRTRTGVGSGLWLESKVLHRLPGYGLAKTLTRQIAGDEAGSRFAPAVMKLGSNALVFAYIIEEHDNGYFTVLLPGSPVGTAGGLQYVPGEQVQRLKVPLARVFNCITSYGIGSGPLFAPHTPGPAGVEPEAEQV